MEAAKKAKGGGGGNERRGHPGEERDEAQRGETHAHPSRGSVPGRAERRPYQQPGKRHDQALHRAITAHQTGLGGCSDAVEGEVGGPRTRGHPTGVTSADGGGRAARRLLASRGETGTATYATATEEAACRSST